jgi:hypothetical protein
VAFDVTKACDMAPLALALAVAACAGGEERPLPRPLVGAGVDAALNCGELRDAAAHGAFEPDAARLACAVDGLDCKVELEAGAAGEPCSTNEVSVAECFSRTWTLRCVPAPTTADAS